MGKHLLSQSGQLDECLIFILSIILREHNNVD